MTGAARPEPNRLRLAFLGDANSIHVRRWAGYFADRGHQVQLLVPRDRAVEPGLPPSIDVETYRPYWDSRTHLTGAWRTRSDLRRRLGQLAPDVLHAHYLTMHGWMARLSGFHPYAVTVWGSDILVTARASARARLYARLTLSGADLVTGDSADLVRAAIAAGARAACTHNVQFGVDTERFRAGPDPEGLRRALDLGGRRVIFSPRTIAPLYRHEVVLRALARLPDDVAILMSRHAATAGDAVEIDRLVGELGLRDRVRIVPTIAHDDMVDAYRLASAVVSVPQSDGTPVTVLEALAVGRPVVASDVPSVREWLGDLDPAALVPVGDVGATAAALAQVLGRPPTQAMDLAERGRALVVERASQAAAMAEAEELYRSLVRNRARGERRVTG